jgi:hypothetical protein
MNLKEFLGILGAIMEFQEFRNKGTPGISRNLFKEFFAARKSNINPSVSI